MRFAWAAQVPTPNPPAPWSSREARAGQRGARKAQRAHLASPSEQAGVRRGGCAQDWGHLSLHHPRREGTPSPVGNAAEVPTRARPAGSSSCPVGPDSPRTFFSASSPPAVAEEAGAAVPVAAAGAASPPGFPATRAAGAGAEAWGAPLAAGVLGAGSWGAAAAASAGACGRVVVVVASPASLMPPALLSAGTSVAVGRRLARLVVAAAGLALGGRC